MCGSETAGFVRVEAASASGDAFSLQPGEQVQLKLQASLAG
ncbi:Aldose 1-epimerase family protein [Pseudomonas syringae pv. cerasicola]|uniref:Aldose 1-epimerase family protein n=1 Tax=Pseudomonas syringae pv. cerasicola TaxID=264451 RepID=A0A0N8R5X4_PSESX|nr:Aldose 1-epimerase family protein [Pseudomonas syringae pv. cerasicola]